MTSAERAKALEEGLHRAEAALQQLIPLEEAALARWRAAQLASLTTDDHAPVAEERRLREEYVQAGEATATVRQRITAAHDALAAARAAASADLDRQRQADNRAVVAHLEPTVPLLLVTLEDVIGQLHALAQARGQLVGKPPDLVAGFTRPDGFNFNRSVVERAKATRARILAAKETP